VTVGLLGGTFDPPHVGHVALAEAAVRELRLERLLVVVVGEAPHKPVDTDAETRLRLAGAAFAGLPRVEVSRQELDRPGPSYTVDTARWAAREFGDVVFVIGADEFADFLSWKEPDEILELVRVAVAARTSAQEERLAAVRARLRRPNRVLAFPFPLVHASSREIRARIARGDAVDELVAPGALPLVHALGLYRGGG
jgi:nicotinate-nucleotide adenylyltransferase